MVMSGSTARDACTATSTTQAKSAGRALQGDAPMVSWRAPIRSTERTGKRLEDEHQQAFPFTSSGSWIRFPPGSALWSLGR